MVCGLASSLFHKKSPRQNQELFFYRVGSCHGNTRESRPVDYEQPQVGSTLAHPQLGAGAPHAGAHGAGAPQAGPAPHPQDDFLHPLKSFFSRPPPPHLGAEQHEGAPQVGATASHPQLGAGAPHAGAHGAGAPQAGAAQGAGAPQAGSAAHPQDDFLHPPKSFLKRPPLAHPPPQPAASQLHQSQLVGAQAPQTTEGPQQPPPPPQLLNNPASALLMLAKPIKPTATTAAIKLLQFMGLVLLKTPTSKTKTLAADFIDGLAVYLNWAQRSTE